MSVQTDRCMSVWTHFLAEISKTVYGPGEERHGVGQRRAGGFWEQGWFMRTTHGVTQGPILRRVPGLASCSLVTVLKSLIIFKRAA